MSTPAKSVPLLSVRRLKVHYPSAGRWPWSAPGLVKAVDDVHFNLNAGEILGVVGGAHSGKSTLVRALVGLQPVIGGGIAYGNKDLARLSRAEWRPLRREIQLVFQEPAAALDPEMTLAQIVEEPLESLLPELGEAERHARAAETLERVGVPRADLDRFPGDFDDDVCRRVGLARALVVRPKVLICDAPIVDAAGSRAMTELLEQIARDYELAMIVTARDPAVIGDLAHRIVVLYLGKVMEQATARELLESPRHPYTKALLGQGEGGAAELTPASAPSGCVFRLTCPMADEMCAREAPHLRRVGPTAHAACHYIEGDAVTSGEFERPLPGRFRDYAAS